MILKSIQWRLQIWHGLVLVAVLAGFGVTAYEFERTRQVRLMDDQLQRLFADIAGAMRPPRPQVPPPPDGGGSDDAGPGFPPPGMHGPRAIRVPPEDAHFFDGGAGGQYFFAVFSPDGAQIQTSGAVPPSDVAAKSLPQSGDSRPPDSGPKPPTVTVLGGYREIVQRIPRGETILLGCPTAPLEAELRRTALDLAGVGAVILFFGLAGGWWISSRAMRPIADISAAAAKIAAGDLSQRINAADADSELGRLAAVLNSAFARLESAFAQQRQFAADAAHELRTPVAVMLTQTQTALQRDRSANEYRDAVEACQRAAQRMRKLIAALLELARLDAGQETMKRVKFDLSRTARESIDMLRPLAAGRGVEIHCDLPPVECEGDPERLAQVVTNLVANAIQYNNDHGEVRVAARRQDGVAMLRVSDTGAGIPAADLPRLFERFYRGDKARSSANNGLGLAISKAIVEAHGGTIEVSSQEKLGATFTVRLPLS